LLNDIRTYTNHPFHLVLVNNDSDPEAEQDCLRIKEEFGKDISMSLIGFTSEVSVSEARNEGARNRHPNSKYICFLDDDCRILGRYNQTTDWLDRLCHLFNEELDIGAVGPIYTWFDPLKCYCVSVACMFTSTKVWETVGGFDPVFGDLRGKGTWGYEDVDWPYRAQALGFKMQSVGGPDFPFYHEDTTIKKKAEEVLKALDKSKQILLSKYDVNKINKFCRTVYPFTADQMEIQGTKLNLGCYRMHLEGWTNIDIKTDAGADRVFNILDISKFYSSSHVNMVLMSQVLEHFTLEEVKKVLKDIYNILTFGGHFIVEVPDCEDLDKKLERGEVTEHTYRVYKHGEPTEFGQEHKAEFTESTLRKLLEETGFKQIVRNPLVSNDLLSIRFDIVKG
jgi:predicted SAM-dependent methyltransferase